MMRDSLFVLKKAKGSIRTVFLPAHLYEKGDFQKISFGTKALRCHIHSNSFSMKDNEIALSEDLFRRLHLPYESPCHLFLSADTIHIGPVIGIFTTGFRDSMTSPFGERTGMFQKFLELADEKGIYIYVFGTQHIDWIEGTTTGFVYQNNQWHSFTFPLPNVIYDRLPNRKTEQHRLVQRIKHRLTEEYMIPWFNSGFFNKWDIFQFLRLHPESSFYLPETYLFPTYDQIEYMLAKYPFVYLKHVNGSAGMNLYQISYNKLNNSYYCRYHTEKGNHLSKFHSLYKLIQTFFKEQRLEQFIAQQGIELLQVKNRIVDFRVHTNKDRHGQWQLSAIAAKVAGKDNSTTHVHTGGTVTSFQTIFSDYEDAYELKRHLTKVAITLSKQLEQSIEGTIGELGFDFGIDVNHRLWLFEANSKPGRAIFSTPLLSEYDALTRHLLMDYMLFLHEQTFLHEGILL